MQAKRIMASATQTSPKGMQLYSLSYTDISYSLSYTDITQGFLHVQGRAQEMYSSETREMHAQTEASCI